nr:hypothetical protein [Tanacetum cinerariifolium]
VCNRNALTDLNQRRGAFIRLNLLKAAITAGGAIVDDAGLAVGAHPAVLVQLRQQVAQLIDLVGFGIDDQFVAIGIDAALVPEKGLHRGHQVVAGAVVERNDFGGGNG